LTAKPGLRAYCLLWALSAASVVAQPRFSADREYAAALEEAVAWLRAGSAHVAREHLARIESRAVTLEDRRALSLLMLEATVADNDYRESYYRASDFASRYPTDPERTRVRLVQGVSAFHAKRPEAAIEALGEVIEQSPSDSLVTEALYWRAMSALDLGRWEDAEADLRQCIDASRHQTGHDRGLFGLGLMLERKGEYASAAERMEQLLTSHPSSPLQTAARIRLASLSLRLNNPSKTVSALEAAEPSNPSEKEEYLLLEAEAQFRLHRYDRAQSAYTAFLRDFSQSPHARKAAYGLAWSYLKGGYVSAAKAEFDTLSHGLDSLAFASLYHSGVIALLEGNADEAFWKFDSLAQASPFETYIDRAYLEMGKIRYRAKHYKDARRYFQLAARLYPESPVRIEAFRLLGESNMAVADFSNAQYGFSQVRKLGGTGRDLADALYQEGVALYHLGRFKSSAERLGEFLKGFTLDDRVGEAYVWRGEALYQDGRFDEAEDVYDRALRLYPKSAKREEAMYGYAWSLFEQKKFTQAASAFDRFSVAYPESERSLEASLRKADCYFFTGQYDRSSELYAALKDKRTDSRTVEYAAFQLAMSYLQRGDTERGIEQLRRFLTTYPSSMYVEVVQFNIGWTYFSKEQYGEAVTEFRTLMGRYPQSQLLPRVFFNTGDAFFNLKLYDSAKVYYQRVVHEYPTSPLVSDALAGLQYTYQAQGKASQAIADIDTLLAKRPEGVSEPDLVLRKGDIFFGQGDFAGAIQAYQQVLGSRPETVTTVKALYQLGRAYDMEDNAPRAVGYYQQAAAYRDAEQAPAAMLALGLAHLKMKQPKAAADDFVEFERRYPDSPLLTEARYQHGLALSGEPDAAINQFQAVIAAYPNDVFADKSRLQIARLLLQKKNYRGSLDTLNALVERRNDDLAADGILLIAENYRAQRKYKDALQSYNDVIQQYTDLPLKVELARMGLGETYEKLGDRKQARSAYEEILKSPVDMAVKKDVEQRLKRLRR
jgi:TolA-binding protein